MALTTVAQAHIDEEITKRMAEIYPLRTQRNSCSLIGRLPAEILAQIFIHHASDHYSEHDYHPITNPPSWVDVSYVCRYWRDVALNCPDLWSYLFVMSRHWTEACLARSKQALLKLHLVSSNGCTCWELHILKQVMDHAEHLQEAHLDLSRMSDDGDEFFSLLSSCIHRLHNLKILVIFSNSEKSSSSSSSMTLFERNVPSLHTLELTYCPIPWYIFRPTGLTTLSLRDVPPQLQQTLVEFLAVLGNMQDLTYLSLNHVIYGGPCPLTVAALHTFQKVNLPHLSCLFVGSTLSIATVLLSCINFPLETEIQLRCFPFLSWSSENFPPSHDDYTIFASTLRQKFSRFTNQALSGMTICSLVVNAASLSEMRFMFSASEHNFGDDRTSKKWGLKVPLQIITHVSPSFMGDNWTHTACEICCAMPLMHVQRIHVIHASPNHKFWKKILAHLPDLHYIKITKGNIPDLAYILSLSNPNSSEGTRSLDWDDGDTKQDPDGMLVPALEKLELCQISFGSYCCSEYQLDADIKSLCNALSTRKNTCGQLIMTQCRLVGMREERGFELVGRWEGGQFHIIKERDWYPCNVSII